MHKVDHGRKNWICVMPSNDISEKALSPRLFSEEISNPNLNF